ncbi:MAG: N-acetyltransferase [Promethearchaeota archaeon]|nr:MAG: N-acetyltransferase [Candidatus Lokiarchaeota archaeon]
MASRNGIAHKYRKILELPGEISILRKTTNLHTEGLYTQIQSPGVLENLTIEIDDIHDFRRYIMFVENQWHMNQDLTYTIFNLHDQIVGQISIYNIAYLHFRGEIGIWIGREYWTHGFGKDALQTIINYSFTQLHLNRLQAHMFVENSTSISLFESVGFQNEGLIREFVRKKEKFRDVYSYSLLKRENPI